MTDKLEKKLETLEEDLKEQKEDLEEVIEEQDDKFEGLIEEQDKNFEQLTNKLEERFQLSINALKAEFSEKIESQQNKIRQLEEVIADNRKELSNQINNSIQELKEQFSGQLKAEKQYSSKLEQNMELSIKKIVNNIENQKAITDERFSALREDISKENQESSRKIDALKEELDTLKISYTINEKNLLEKVKEVIKVEVKNAVQGYEKEALMNVWIDELGEIIKDFDKLKQQNPEDFELHVKKIASTIELFRQKLKT